MANVKRVVSEVGSGASAVVYRVVSSAVHDYVVDGADEVVLGEVVGNFIPVLHDDLHDTVNQ